MTFDNNIASIDVVNYQRLTRGDPEEQQSLLRACQTKGFFYLDLSGTETRDYVDSAREMVSLAVQYFSKPLEEKRQDTSSELDIFNICGFKPMGLDSGNVTRRKDGCEGLRIPSDLCHNVKDNSRLFKPYGIESEWSSVEAFTRQSNRISRGILASLSDILHVSRDSRFENFHKPNKSSTSNTVLQHYPLDNLSKDMSSGHFAHTDTGLVTLLFTTTWGLQVFDNDVERWRYVQPPDPDCAIVNIGDTLKFLSNGILTSSLHRVTPTVSEQGAWKSGSRYSVIFFLRANDDAEFVDSEGQSWTAKSWLRGKMRGYRSDHDEQLKSAIVTGKVGFNGVLEGHVNTNGIAV